MSILGVVRGATELYSLVYEVGEPHDPARPWDRSHRCVLRPYRGPLVDDWNALAAVRAWNADTLAHVLAILGGTVPPHEPERDLPSLGPEVHPAPPPRATAAHPRAYRGTRYKPPRPAAPDLVDLRPYLLSRRHIDQVLRLLGHVRVVETSERLPAWFVTYLVPLIDGDPGAFATLAHALDLATDLKLRATLVGVYLEAGDPRRALAWWEHVLAHDPAGRLETAQLVVASGVAKIEPPDAASAGRFAEAAVMQRWAIYRALAAGASPAYLVSGVELDVIPGATALPLGSRGVTALVESTVSRLAEHLDEYGGVTYWVWQLWRLLGNRAGLEELLESPAFIALEPAAAYQLIVIVDSLDDGWAEVGLRLPALAEIVAKSEPRYQAKLAEDLCEVFWWAVANEFSVHKAFAGCIECARRVARAPFDTRAVIGVVLPSIAMLYSEDVCQRRDIENASEASWLALEKACGRKNLARLIGWGLNRIAQRAPELLVSAFRCSPAALLQTADRLAMLSFEAATELLDRYASSSLAQHCIAAAPLEYLCALVEPITRAGGHNPVRRELRRHLAGETTLSDAQLEGHRARLAAELETVRLAWIRQQVDARLAARVGLREVTGHSERHALAMLDDPTHRRQLRRLLAATFDGDLAWRDRHPRTNEWFARHPKLDREKWRRGIVLTREMEGVGRVRIAIEQDPLEALQLGTYVGSCLSRGGGFQHSAVAVVLDANKQVVYARDKRGRVLARQLIAISEDDHLVCFEIYGPWRTRLEGLFVEFDRELARVVGVPIWSSSEAHYEIANILSREWYDDTAWVP